MKSSKYKILHLLIHYHSWGPMPKHTFSKGLCKGEKKTSLTK